MTDGDRIITSRQNPWVKQVRKLHRSKERISQGLMLLEGTNLVEAALAIAHPLTAVCFTAAWRSRYSHLWQLLERAQQSGTELWPVSESVLESLSTTAHPDGVVATAPRQPPQRSRLPCSLGIGLETLQDPGNLGTMIRTAAAAGAEGLWLSADSVALDHPKVLRASAGQWFRQPLAVTETLTTTVEAARREGMRILATQPQARCRHWEVDWKRPSLILLGNEGAGLSPALLGLADELISIPLAPGVESLNVAISLAILLYEAQRQRSQC